MTATPPREAEATAALLARSVVHELRQSLSLIVGYAELLTRPDLAEADRARLLAELRIAAARLAGSLARLERGEGLEAISFGPGGHERVLDRRA